MRRDCIVGVMVPEERDEGEVERGWRRTAGIVGVLNEGGGKVQRRG